MDFMRIGDSERDEAVNMLREHHMTGRLTTEEFDDRMSQALVARTQNELNGLFTDLPTPKPGSAGRVGYPEPVVSPPSYGYDTAPAPYAYDTAPAPFGEPPAQQVESSPGHPWYAQWWVVVVAAVLAGMLDLSWAIVIFAALWVWVIYPAIGGKMRKQVAPPAPPRPLTYGEREYVMEELRAGRKIMAIKRYRELTGADLRAAKNAVESWERQIGR